MASTSYYEYEHFQVLDSALLSQSLSLGEIIEGLKRLIYVSYLSQIGCMSSIVISNVFITIGYLVHKIPVNFELDTYRIE
jgi:hypothetical protein